MSVSGVMWSRRSLALTCLLGGTLSALAAGCGREAPSPVPLPPPEVTVASPVARSIPNTLDFTGSIRGNQRIELRPRVSGFLNDKLVADGQRVEAGDVLFQIDPREYDAEVAKAQAELASREADARLADVSLTRTRMALEQGAGNQQELDRAIATRDAAIAAVDLAKAQFARAELDVEFTQIVSPIAGRVGFIDVEEGDLISGPPVSGVLATVIDDSLVYAMYEVDEQTLFRIRESSQNRRPGEDGRPTHVVRIRQSGETGFPHEGAFVSADNTIDPETGTIRVEAVFQNPDGAIIPGAFVRIRAFLGERDALLVPEVAVLVDQAGRYVMLVDEQNMVHRVGVEPAGDPSEGLQPIQEIVPEGEAGRLNDDARIIVNGLQRARPGGEVNPTTASAVGSPSGAGTSPDRPATTPGE